MSGGDLDGVLSPYLRRQRLEAARPYIRGRVLDFGCGTADICAFVGEGRYVGVDIDGSILEVARRRYPSAGFYTPAEYSKLPPGEFDTVSALAVIEHLPDPAGFLGEMKSKLAPSGKIVLTTPNPMLDWAHGLGSRVGIFAKESHDEHQSLLDRAGIAAAAAAAGLKVLLYRRFLFGANQLAVLGSRMLLLIGLGGILPA